MRPVYGGPVIPVGVMRSLDGLEKASVRFQRVTEEFEEAVEALPDPDVPNKLKKE